MTDLKDGAAESDIAYAAGFFDGEGSLGVCRPDGKSVSIRAFWSQNDPYPLLWLQELFGGTIASHSDRKAWQFTVANQGAADALAAMLPYLIVKADRVEYVLEIHRTARSGEKDAAWKMWQERLWKK